MHVWFSMSSQIVQMAFRLLVRTLKVCLLAALMFLALTFTLLMRLLAHFADREYERQESEVAVLLEQARVEAKQRLAVARESGMDDEPKLPAAPVVNAEPEAPAAPTDDAEAPA